MSDLSVAALLTLCYVGGLLLFIHQVKLQQQAMANPWKPYGALDLETRYKLPVRLRELIPPGQATAPLFKRYYPSGAVSHRVRLGDNTVYLSEGQVKRYKLRERESLS